MNNWKKAVVPSFTPIIKAIALIDEAALQIALVVDDSYRLIGTVTDGDIRRAILQGIDLNEPVCKIMQKKFSFVWASDNREKVLAVMKNKNLHHLPILDETQKLVGLYTIDELMTCEKWSNPVVLMAGGMGERLKPLTDNCPKPMLRVGGKPMLESILDNFIAHGFKHFYISVNYRAEMIQSYFGDGSQWGIDINYLHETQKLGTGGALSLLSKKIDKPIIVMNGDILTKVNYSQLMNFHKGNNSCATLCVHEYRQRIPYGVVSFKEDCLVNIKEKPMESYFINAGIYVFNPDVLSLIPEDSYFDMPDLFKVLLKNHKPVSVFPIREYWVDIGRFDDYEKANGDFEAVFG